jgi:3-deoxy-manno-octulosonate cytidylyltransferase (CMP-KDO synthetase)
MVDIVGIIPARYSSSRFPGKPLVKILGKTLLQRTYENALLSPTLKKLIIATDDRRIYDHAKSFGADVAMTSIDCLTGTDRLAEVVRYDSSLANAEIIVNIQGDEPCVSPAAIDALSEVLKKDSKASMSTVITPICSDKEALNPSVVKCVIDLYGYALYFSRALIPAHTALTFNPSVTYYKHIGIYAYRRDFLLHYAELLPTPMQLAESLEQLKVLEHGYRIKTAIVDYECVDVNTPEDIQKVEQLLCKQNILLFPGGSVPHSEKA